MKDGTPTVLYTKETRGYARHVRYWRDVRGSQVSLFSCLSRMHHVTRVCATSGECQDQPVFVHVKRVTLQVITGEREHSSEAGHAQQQRPGLHGRHVRARFRRPFTVEVSGRKSNSSIEDFPTSCTEPRHAQLNKQQQ
jgi:hypothetical protein